MNSCSVTTSGIYVLVLSLTEDMDCVVVLLLVVLLVGVVGVTLFSTVAPRLL